MPRLQSRRNHVDMIGLGASLAFHFRDGHLACLGKQLRQMALVLRIEVLDQHECHASIVRQMAEQLRECLQSAGGGSYANNWEGTAFGAVPGGGPLDSCRLAWPAFAGLLYHTRHHAFLTCTNRRYSSRSFRIFPISMN